MLHRTGVIGPSGESVSSQLKRGLRTTAAIFAAGAWLFVAFSGVGVAFTPAPPPHWVGWILITAAACVAIVTVDRWVKMIPGLLAYAAIFAVITAATGYTSAYRSVVMPRGEALVMALLFAGSAGLATTLTSRKLTATDRFALFGVLVSFVTAVASKKMSLAGSGLMFVCLAIAWAHARLSGGAAPHLRSRIRRS